MSNESNDFYFNNSNNNVDKHTQTNNGLLLMIFSIVLIAIGYVMMISGMFDKVSKVETTIDNKIVYQGKDELVKVKVNTNSEFNPVVKFRSKNGKFTVSEDRQEGKEVETKIIAKESGEDILIVEVGREEGKKDKKEEIKILICEEPKLLNTTDKILSMKEETNLQLKFNVDDKCLEGYQIYVENDKVADIDNNYLLNAKKSGKTTLVLKGSNKTIKYTLNVKPLRVNVTGVKINTKNFNLAIGKTKNLSVTVKPSDATNKKVTYESSDTNIATVTSSGKVKGINTGVAIITVTSEDNSSKKDTVKVKVYKPEPPVSTLKVESIKFDKTSESIYVVESKSLTTTISPSNATNKTITCTSSNNSIATVSVRGNACAVKGVAVGTTTITATTKDGNKKATASVTISNKPVTTISVTGIKFDKTSESMYVGESKSLTTTITPSNATNKTITCTSSNNSIATVSVSGNACAVKGVAAGSVTITVTTKDGNKKATASVTISNKPVTTISVTGIKFDKTSDSIYVGDSKSLTATITPSNATNKAITCTSSNNSVATVSVSGNSCVVKGVKAGTITITATTKDGNKKATASVTISNKPVSVVSVTGIKFDKTKESVYVGESKSLTTTITPNNATNKTITCTSSNNSIATVSVSSNACVVKGVKAGTATITATTKDGNKKATSSVTINNKPAPVVSVTSIKFEKSSYSVPINQAIVAVVGITPSNATNKTITCKSLNTGIVTVTYSGNKCTIKGVKVGTTTIEAYSVDGNKKTTTIVTVSPIKVTSLNFEKESYAVDANAQITANINVTPSNASSKVITCSSSDTKIATVSAKNTSCVIKGVKPGSVTITAKTQDGSNKSTTTKVTVKNVPVTQEYTIEYNCNSGKGTVASQKVKTGEKFTLNANACSKNYHTFAGWIDPSGKTWSNKYSGIWNYTNGQYGITNNKLVLKAKWNGALKTASPKKPINAYYVGKCEDLTNNRKNPNGAGSSFSKADTPYLYAGEYCSYESETLKYYIERPTSRYTITHIWVKDAYNQMKIAVAEYDSNYKFKKSKSNEIMEHEIKAKGYSNKALVGINASAMIAGSYYPNAKRPDWLNQPAVTFFINDGKIIRYPDYDYFVTTQPHKGLTKDGYLTYYNFSQNKEKNDATIKEMLNDGIKYVFGFYPVLVYKKSSLYSGASSWNSPNIREAVGQIDLNNFVFITNTLRNDGRETGLSFKEIADIMVSLGVYNGYNCDGGGSTSYFYKSKTATLTGPGKAYDGRTSGDILYFVEK